MSLTGQTVLITGASMGIGAAIAHRLAKEKATLILLSRSPDKLSALADEIRPTTTVHTLTADVSNATQLTSAITSLVANLDNNNHGIDILINNAGLALGAPAPFPAQSIADITTMTSTNINGLLYATHAVLNAGRMHARGTGTIVNITSVTGLEVPPFPGEAVYHASKAAQEAFTNALRIELGGTNVRVVAVRPGVVATNFHEQRVGYDKGLYESFVEGYEPLVADDVAEAVAYVVGAPERVAVKAVDVVPTAQRSLGVFDREWKGRNGGA